MIERPIQLVDLEMDCEPEGEIKLEESVESQAKEDTMKRATTRAKLNAREKIKCIMEGEMEGG